MRIYHRRINERGSVLVLVAAGLVVFLGFAALVVDIGRLYVERARLQNAVDAASTAAAFALPSELNAETVAMSYAVANVPGVGAVTGPSDIDIGFWDTATRTFNADTAPYNAVRVHAERSAAYGNPVQNLFAGVLGSSQSEVGATAIALKQRAVIDFEGLGEGAQPATVSSGNGISGDPIGGYVAITANGGFGPMIFDSTCDYHWNSPTDHSCSGEDWDLETPTTGSDQGDILIISEDGDSSDPDDLGGPCPSAASPPSPPPTTVGPSDFVSFDCTIVLDFSAFGSGSVVVEEITVIDTEEDALVWLYRDGELVGIVSIEEASDHQVAVRPVDGAPAADLMVLQLFGSGGIDDVGYSEVVSLVG